MAINGRLGVDSFLLQREPEAGRFLAWWFCPTGKPGYTRSSRFAFHFYRISNLMERFEFEFEFIELELELELIQSHMTQKPMLRSEVGACRITQLTSTAKKQQNAL